jgi:nitrite reductase/ring-hydroxylating ferredoxin subunit
MTPAVRYAGARLCAADAIPDGGAREVFVGPQDDPLHVVLFRRGESIHAYRNVCPHFLLPLNAGPGRFILLKDGLVMCAWHSAVFRISDGAGVDGPCMGGSLEPLPLVQDGGMLFLGGAPAEPEPST